MTAAAVPLAQAPESGSLPPCPMCKAPWKEGAVLCTVCGYDARTSRQLSTVRGVEDEPPVVRPTGGLAMLRTGLLLHGIRVFLLIVSIYLGLIVAVLSVQVQLSVQEVLQPQIQGDAKADDQGGETGPSPSDFAPFVAAIVLSLILIVLAMAQSVLGIAGSIQCLGVPRESKARRWIMASLVCDAAAFLMACGVLWAAWQRTPSFDLRAAAVIAPAAVAVADIPLRIASLPGLAAWIFFMLFLRNLGYYLDRRDEAAQAVGIIVHGLIALFAFPLFVIPLVVVGVGIMLLPMGFYGAILHLHIVAATALAWIVYGIWILYQIIGFINALRRELVPKA